MTGIGTRIAIQSTGVQATNTLIFFLDDDTNSVEIILPKMKLAIERSSLMPIQ